jgi:kinesin family member 18/19
VWENTYHLVTHKCCLLLTCSGTPEDPGLIYLTTQELFERCAALTDKKVEVTLSFLEIYNETIRDLLVPVEESKPLQLREDASQRISVPGLSTASPIGVCIRVEDCNLIVRLTKS